jgi:hypothetical protein
MSFRENILKKIKIDKTAAQVIHSIGPPDSGRKVDKNAMRRLLEMAPYSHRKERDLDLYVENIEAETKKILVLDNDLAIYHTHVEDVVLRKSPTVKEMISIRNAIKILNDSDVVMSKKEASVKTIQKECTAMLDLSYNESDLDHIAADGAASLTREYADGVIECLDIFAEILGFAGPPKAFKIGHHKMIGAVNRKPSGEVVYGPMVLYSMVHNRLSMIDQSIGSFDKEKIELLQQIAAGNTEGTAAAGADVFDHLKQMAIHAKSENQDKGSE